MYYGIHMSLISVISINLYKTRGSSVQEKKIEAEQSRDMCEVM